MSLSESFTVLLLSTTSELLAVVSFDVSWTELL